MIIKVMTLFPEMFEGPLNASIIQRAREKELIDIEYLNIRDFSNNKHKKVDDYPYGGGPGMVMTPEPIYLSYKSIMGKLGKTKEEPRVIYLSPKGKTFNQEMAKEFSKEETLIFICGHYEGVDERIIEKIVTDEVSIGDYVLTGGEIPAMVMIDSIARLIPGVLSQDQSYEDESFYSNLLEYPQYTRPRVFQDMEVPQVLLSGNHKDIEEWRKNKSLEITSARRPDLLEKYIPNKREKGFIEDMLKNKNKP